MEDRGWATSYTTQSWCGLRRLPTADDRNTLSRKSLSQKQVKHSQCGQQFRSGAHYANTSENSLFFRLHDRKHAKYRHLVPIDPYIVSCVLFAHSYDVQTYIQSITNAKKLKFIQLVYSFVVHALRHIFAATHFSFTKWWQAHTRSTIVQLQLSIWSDAFGWSRGWRNGCGGNRCAWFLIRWNSISSVLSIWRNTFSWPNNLRVEKLNTPKEK